MTTITLHQGPDVIDGSVFTEHFRPRDYTGKPQPKGGMTLVIISLDDGVVMKGVARCSKQDNYSRKLGRTIAFGRALKQLKAAGYEAVV